ncbi:MAG: DNA adenine methylase [Coprothermobacterota bacterium]|nr:DNA adenine methylase [Coprothermobacterota bacterium]
MHPSNIGYQITFFDTPVSEHVVNVASVPQRSPFRYPGGKTWLIPCIRQWLTSLDKRPSVFLEPFVGGGIVGLTVAFEGLAEHVILVELDKQVAAVWQTILGGEAEWLAERILNFDVTLPSVMEVLSLEPNDSREEAFRTIIKNRTFHGGILAPGSALIKNGENGKGIKSRWYPETLAKRIRAIECIRDKITFIFGDGIAVMQDYTRSNHTAFFVDPPYTAGGANGKRAGKRLYTHHEIDHEYLFSTATRVVGDILLTYDDSPDVRDLASRYSFEVKSVAMKNTHHAKMTELLISHNLEWLH